LTDSVGILNALRHNQHDGIDWLDAVRQCVDGKSVRLGVEQGHPVSELRQRVGSIVPPPNDHGSLDQFVGDGSGQRVPEDDLLFRRRLVWCSRESDENPRIEVTDRLRKRWTVVAVVLVCKDDKVLDSLQMGVELGSKTLLELVSSDQSSTRA